MNLSQSTSFSQSIYIGLRLTITVRITLKVHVKLRASSKMSEVWNEKEINVAYTHWPTVSVHWYWGKGYKHVLHSAKCISPVGPWNKEKRRRCRHVKTLLLFGNLWMYRSLYTFYILLGAMHWTAYCSCLITRPVFLGNSACARQFKYDARSISVFPGQGWSVWGSNPRRSNGLWLPRPSSYWKPGSSAFGRFSGFKHLHLSFLAKRLTANSVQCSAGARRHCPTLASWGHLHWPEVECRKWRAKIQDIYKLL